MLRRVEETEDGEVIKKLFESLKARRRRRALAKIRREFEKAGYPLDQFGDSQIEAALTRRTKDIAAVVLHAHAIYRTLRRLRGATAKGKAAISGDILPQAR